MTLGLTLTLVLATPLKIGPLFDKRKHPKRMNFTCIFSGFPSCNPCWLDENKNRGRLKDLENSFQLSSVQIPVPSGQNGGQMPSPIVRFVCQSLQSSLIKLVYKHANTCFVTFYLYDDAVFTRLEQLQKLLRMT